MACRLPDPASGRASPGFQWSAVLQTTPPRERIITSLFHSTRWRIVWLLTFISMFRSMDGLNFSVAARQIMPDYGLSQIQIGVLYTAYALGYALFHLPSGRLADVFGPRRVLGVALLLWSLFTGLTALAPSLPGLGLLGPFTAFLVVRFLIGLAEGACYPASSRMLANWMKPDERGTAGGLVTGLGIGVGYAITPPIVAFLMVRLGWRLPFYTFSVLGMLLAAWWYRYSAESPDQHRSISPQELQEIRDSGAAGHEVRQAAPWKAIFTSPNVWRLGAAGFCFGYAIYMYQSWFYLYLINVRGFSEIRGGFLTAGPFIGVTIFSPLGGWISDALVRRRGRTSGRRTGAIFGFVSSAICIAAGASTTHPYLAVALLSLGDGFLYFSGSSSLATIIDIGGPHAGVTYGVVVSAIQLGGVVAPTLTPLLAQRFGWQVAIYVVAGLSVVASTLWSRIDAAQVIGSE
jgi:ACS family glucarate transporter-like MFS transporter